MVRVITLLVGTAMLTACGADVKGIRLAEVDLTNMRTVQDLRTRLDPVEGAALATYVAEHNSGSAGFCGQALTNSDGKSPETLGEAIALTIAREREERIVLAKAKRLPSPRELGRKSWSELTSERDMVIDAQSRLRFERGRMAEQLPEWAALQRKKAQIDEKLVLLKPGVFGPNT